MEASGWSGKFSWFSKFWVLRYTLSTRSRPQLSCSKWVDASPYLYIGFLGSWLEFYFVGCCDLTDIAKVQVNVHAIFIILTFCNSVKGLFTSWTEWRGTKRLRRIKKLKLTKHVCPCTLWVARHQAGGAKRTTWVEHQLFCRSARHPLVLNCSPRLPAVLVCTMQSFWAV